jgi:hypothetical protein
VTSEGVGVAGQQLCLVGHDMKEVALQFDALLDEWWLSVSYPEFSVMLLQPYNDCTH